MVRVEYGKAGLSPDLRDELGVRSCPISPALEALSDEAWGRLRKDWERFAVSRSMKVGDLIRRTSEFWRGARSDAPWQIVFRRAYEELANRPGERRVGANPVVGIDFLSRASLVWLRRQSPC